MTVYESLFWFFSVAMLLSGLLVILSSHPLTSALSLVALFFFMAGLFVLLDAFFLAAIQILVYAGAVMVLFLFVIMLLDATEPRRWWAKNPLGLLGGPLVAGALGVAIWRVLRRTQWPAPPAGASFDGTLAQVLGPVFKTYLLPLEVTAVLLLVATIGVVVLGRKEPQP